MEEPVGSIGWTERNHWKVHKTNNIGRAKGKPDELRVKSAEWKTMDVRGELLRWSKGHD